MPSTPIPGQPSPDGPAPEEAAPEGAEPHRRGASRRRFGVPGLFGVPAERARTADFLAVGAIAVIVVLVAVIALVTGSARTAEHHEAAETQPDYAPSNTMPTSLREEWDAPNDTVGTPLVSSSNVITTSENALTAWEAGIKSEEWSYSRDTPLCDATYFDSRIVTVFQGPAGCSDATAFRASDGKYDGIRQSAFSEDMTAWTSWSHMLVLGPDRLELWRDDLVRTVEYGHVPAPQETGQQPRSGCSFQSANLNSENFAVAERCPGEDTVRITVSKAVPEDSRVPEEVSSTLTDLDQFHYIGLTESNDSVGLALRGSEWMFVRVDSGGSATSLGTLDHEPALKPSPENVSRDPAQFRWFDGETTHAFDARIGDMQWSMQGATGPGHGFGFTPAEQDERFTPTQAIVPSRDALNFVDIDTGEVDSSFELDLRSQRDEPVGLAQIGNILYVQKDGLLTAYQLTDSTS
ncbi:hypothetical protein [Dietzia timorensis]|uniref:Uncharacterized protein n=1 Tax=Dietzia timorensis TaxID=499555 RepID=A0A173LMQ0_9ACTN|nr:hypothetical protein [Dietzia timorensis]ANI91840.1 Hypothetical protein BJL86_1047 [Dietzia timorensis]